MVELYLGPPCPSLLLIAKSICILVTSGGNIAAPGPTLIASNWEVGQLNLLVGWSLREESTFCEAKKVSTRTKLGLNLRTTYCCQFSHTLYYAHHLECGLGGFCRTFDSQRSSEDTP